MSINKGWILLFKSKDHLDYLQDHKPYSILFSCYLVIDGALKCSDGRIFGEEGKINLAISLITLGREPVEKMIKEGIIDSNSVVLMNDIRSEELHYSDEGTDIKKAKYFELHRDFKKYLLSLQVKY